MKKICLLETYFLQNALSNSVLLALSLSVQRFQMLLEGLGFSENVGNIKNCLRNRQNMAKIVCFR